MADAGDAHALALEYLDAVQAALAYSPGGQILERAFVSPGLPDWDCCPQLSVHIASVDDAETAPTSPFLQSGHRITTTGVVLLLPLIATVLRCNPVAQGNNAAPPTPTQIEAAAVKTNGDLWAVTNYLVHAKRQNTLFAPPPDGERREVFLDPAISLRPQGGCAGWAFSVRVQLDGFQPA